MLIVNHAAVEGNSFVDSAKSLIGNRAAMPMASAVIDDILWRAISHQIPKMTFLLMHTLLQRMYALSL